MSKCNIISHRAKEAYQVSFIPTHEGMYIVLDGRASGFLYKPSDGEGWYDEDSKIFYNTLDEAWEDIMVRHNWVYNRQVEVY